MLLLLLHLLRLLGSARCFYHVILLLVLHRTAWEQVMRLVRSELLLSLRLLLWFWQEDRSDVVRNQMLLLAMVDHPLRVLAACAQIGVGMWRRNGMGALSQLVNYASPPLCTRLRDLDLTMLQYALATRS